MASAQRIVSFLPSATEMLCALGLGERLLGITHECDFPADVRGKPIVVRNALPIEHMAQHEIDAAVTERLRNGLSLYEVDEALMRDIGPDLILTQDLCQVCAPSGDEVAHLLRCLTTTPQVLWLTPTSLDEIFGNLRELGNATGRLAEAEALISGGRARLARVEAATQGIIDSPRVFCMEWMDPIYCSGHWVPEMVRLAGGIDRLGREGEYSVRIPWEDVRHWAPEVLVLMPCGFDLQGTVERAQHVSSYPGWADLPAVRNDRVYAVDANAYFARPGPRVVDGTELLAHILHPDLCGWSGPPDAFRRLEPDQASP